MKNNFLIQNAYARLACWACTIALAAGLLSSCKKEEEITLLKTLNITLSAQSTVPKNEGRTETGTASLKLYSDNMLEYSISVSNVAASKMTVAHIHKGSAAENGSVVLPLVDNSSTVFTNNAITKKIQLTATDAAIITGTNHYLMVHSNEKASGLLRGQAN